MTPGCEDKADETDRKGLRNLQVFLMSREGASKIKEVERRGSVSTIDRFFRFEYLKIKHLDWGSIRWKNIVERTIRNDWF